MEPALDPQPFPLNNEVAVSTQLESVWMTCNISAESWLVGTVYRPPTDTNFTEKFDELLWSLPLDSFSGHIIIGDFNIDWNFEKNNSKLFADLQRISDSNGLHPLVKEQTRHSSTLDLLFTSRPDRVLDVDVVNGLGNSDHAAVSFKIAGRPGRLKKLLRTCFMYKKANVDHLKDLLSAVPWNSFISQDIDASWSSFLDVFTACIKDSVPSRRQKKQTKSWITPEIRKLITLKNRLFRRAKKTGCDNLWTRYKSFRNKLSNSIKLAHANHINKLLQSKDGKKHFWSFIRARPVEPEVRSFNVDGHECRDTSRIADAFN